MITVIYMKLNNDIDSFEFIGEEHFPNILLLHGLGSNGSELRELGRYLNKKGYTVYMKRYTGNGVSVQKFYNSSVKQWFKDATNAYLELDKNQNNTYVCGISMGGSFALKLASMYNVKGLITMNAPVFGFTEESILKQIEIESKFVKNISEDDKIKMHTLKKGYSDFIDELGMSINLSKITANTLIIQGLKDDERFIESSKLIIKRISSKNKKIIHFNESGHVITMEKEKKEVFETILKFISNIEV